MSRLGRPVGTPRDGPSPAGVRMATAEWMEIKRGASCGRVDDLAAGWGMPVDRLRDLAIERYGILEVRRVERDAEAARARRSRGRL